MSRQKILSDKKICTGDKKLFKFSTLDRNQNAKSHSSIHQGLLTLDKSTAMISFNLTHFESEFE